MFIAYFIREVCGISLPTYLLIGLGFCCCTMVWEYATRKRSSPVPFHSTGQIVAYLVAVMSLWGEGVGMRIVQMVALIGWGRLVLPRKPLSFQGKSMPSLFGEWYGRWVQCLIGTAAAGYCIILLLNLEQVAGLMGEESFSPYAGLLLMVVIAAVVVGRIGRVTTIQEIGLVIVGVCLACMLHIVHAIAGKMVMFERLNDLVGVVGSNSWREMLEVLVCTPLLLQPLFMKGRGRNWVSSVNTGAVLLLAMGVMEGLYALYLGSKSAHAVDYRELVGLLAHVRGASLLVVQVATLMYLAVWYIVHDVWTPLVQEKGNVTLWRHYLTAVAVAVTTYILASYHLAVDSWMLCTMWVLVIPAFLISMVGIAPNKQVFYKAMVGSTWLTVACVAFLHYSLHYSLVTREGKYGLLLLASGSVCSIVGGRYLMRRKDLDAPLALCLAFFSFVCRTTVLLWMGCDILLFVEILVQVLLHLGLRYFTTKGVVFVRRFWKEKAYMPPTIAEMNAMAIAWLKAPFGIMRYADRARRQYGYLPGRYFVWIIVTCALPLGAGWAETAELRLMVAKMQVLSLILALTLLGKDYWPTVFIRGYRLYMYLVLTYSLVFLPAFTYLALDAPVERLIHIALSILLLATLVSRTTLVLSVSMGLLVLWRLVVGQTYAPLCYGWKVLGQVRHYGYLVTYTYVSSLIIGVLFASYQEKAREERHESLYKLLKRVIHFVTNSVGMGKSHASMVVCVLNSRKTTEYKSGDTVTISLTKKNYALLREYLEKIGKSYDVAVREVRSYDLPYQEIRREEFAEHTVATCLEEAVDMYNESTGCALQIFLEKMHDFSFFGSDTLLKEAVIALLENARRFGGPDCPVRIWIRNGIVYIEDSGPGIAAHIFPHIFVEFFTTYHTAVGMGLPFVVRTIESFGGRVHCSTSVEQSKSYTRFAIYLPSTS